MAAIGKQKSLITFDKIDIEKNPNNSCGKANI